MPDVGGRVANAARLVLFAYDERVSGDRELDVVDKDRLPDCAGVLTPATAMGRARRPAQVGGPHAGHPADHPVTRQSPASWLVPLRPRTAHSPLLPE